MSSVTRHWTGHSADVVMEFIRRVSRENDSRTGSERFQDWYFWVILAASVVAVFVTFLVNASTLIGPGILTPEIGAPIAGLSSDYVAFVVAFGLSILFACIWGVFCSQLGPVSMPFHVLIWLFQAPIDTLRLLGRRQRWVLFSSVVIGLVGGVCCSLPILMLDSMRLIEVISCALLCAIGCTIAGVLSVRRQTMKDISSPFETHKPFPVPNLSWYQLEASAGKSMLLQWSASALRPFEVLRMFFVGTPSTSRSKEGFSHRLLGKPAWVVATMDWRVWRRHPYAVAALLVTGLYTVALAVSPVHEAPFLFLIILFVGTYLAAEVSSLSGRQDENSRNKYDQLPLSKRTESIAHLIVPSVLMTGWTLVTWGVIGIAFGQTQVLASAVVVGIGMGAVSNYNARRQGARWGAETYLATPLGPVPIISIINFFKGAALALAVIVPGANLMFATEGLMAWLCVSIFACAISFVVSVSAGQK